MITLNLVETGLIVELVVLCLAVGLGLLAVLSRRSGGLIWFVDCFAWAGVVIVWNNEIIQIIGIVMAVVSLMLFILD